MKWILVKIDGYLLFQIKSFL